MQQRKTSVDVISYEMQSRSSYVSSIIIQILLQREC
jgi:hypothetical protein